MIRTHKLPNGEFAEIKDWKIGDWAYCANIPGTGQITNFSFPWYLSEHILYEVKFQDHYYFVYDWELE